MALENNDRCNGADPSSAAVRISPANVTRNSSLFRICQDFNYKHLFSEKTLMVTVSKATFNCHVTPIVLFFQTNESTK